MPPKSSSVTITKNRPAGSAPIVAPIVASESLLATDAEKHATSKSLYGDHKARVSSNVHVIHDKLRLRAFQTILQAIKGKSVLHIGCGVGLLSMMMARAMAKRVLAVDSSTIVEAAQVVAKQNKLDNIQFLRVAKLAEAGLVEKFDFVVCEWMGSFLTNDPSLSDVVYARDNLLAPGGVVCPDRSSIHVLGISDYSYYFDSVEYWNNVYGFTMKPMKELVLREASTCHIPKNCLATNSCLLHTVHTSDYSEANGGAWSAPFSIHATKKATLHFLTFYVDCGFTSASDPGANFVIGFNPGGNNAWTEVSVALSESLPVNAGDVITGQISVTNKNKATEVQVVAVCNGSVVAPITVTGKYIYQL